jgi:DNA-directed RNA polymerase III subunit RPC3
MCNDPLCQMASPLNGKYMLNLAEMASAVRQLTLESAVHHKFGNSAARIFRLLLRVGSAGGFASADRPPLKLEVKQLADKGMMAEREARTLLERMLKAGFVSLQELPRSADHNPKTTLYVWHVELPRACRALEAELLTTEAKMALALADERRKAEVKGKVAPADGARRAALLEAAMLRAHESAMLLRFI